MLDLFIQNGFIIDLENDGDIVKKNIGIKNGNITYIGTDILEAREIYEAKGKIIFPGLINSHIHFGEYFLKGYNGKLSTSEYIDYAEKFNEENLTYKEDIRKLSTLITIYESMTFGTTTFMGIRGFDCAEKLGLRLYMGYPLMKSNKLKQYLNNAFQNIDELINTELNNYYIFLHSLKWVDEEILLKLSSYLKSNKNIKLGVHVSETKEENVYINDKYKMTPIEMLDKYDLLSERTLLVHCNYLKKSDIDLIKKYNCSVAVCPNSNLKLNNNIPKISKMVKLGINVMIATDGSATNDSLNLLDSCRTVGLLTKLSSNEIIKMITINCDKYFKKGIGSIKVGSKADILLFDLSDLRILRKEVFINNLIYSSGLNPSNVLVNGKFLIKDNKNLILNCKNLFDQKEELNRLLSYSEGGKIKDE